VAPCAIYIVHVKMRSMCFLVEPQNQGRRFVSGLAQNHCDGLSVVWPQNYWDDFLQFDLKTSDDSFLVEHQNQGGGGFSGLGFKTDSYGLVIWASK
jgi:hypothetical protein